LAESDRFVNVAPGLLPQAERARELKIHPATLARARARGDLGFIRIGDKVYYERKHIVEWLESLERPRRARKP
jgi:helix-turn-helix protein